MTIKLLADGTTVYGNAGNVYAVTFSGGRTACVKALTPEEAAERAERGEDLWQWHAFVPKATEQIVNAR